MLEAPYLQTDPSHSPRDARDDHGAPARDANGQPLPVDETPVSTIMTTDVVTFAADVDIASATRTMLDRGISGAPILDESGRPVGMVCKTDLLEAWAQSANAPEGQGLSTVVVGDIMVPYLLAVSCHAPISLAAALMAYEGVHRLLVLDESNQMVGIVSALDVLRWLAQITGFCLPRYTQRQRA